MSGVAGQKMRRASLDGRPENRAVFSGSDPPWHSASDPLRLPVRRRGANVNNAERGTDHGILHPSVTARRTTTWSCRRSRSVRENAASEIQEQPLRHDAVSIAKDVLHRCAVEGHHSATHGPKTTRSGVDRRLRTFVEWNRHHGSVVGHGHIHLAEAGAAAQVVEDPVRPDPPALRVAIRSPPRSTRRSRTDRG